jgi:glycosyltransferase involved in cell wall biosynthesis
MKVAIVHDWLTAPGGAEKVLEHLLALWPHAQLFTVVDFLKKGDRGFLKDREVKTTFIQNLPFAQKHYRHYLPLMPIAIEQLDLSKFDLVISSSYAVAKGIITGPDTTHVCYCHSPVRYGWDLQHQYLNESNLRTGVKSALARTLLHYLRMWDVRTAFGVDLFIANSQFTARRIRKAYGRTSLTIPPPVEAKQMPLVTIREDYYVSVSRLVPYKRMDLIAAAFSKMPDKKLVLIGDGPDLEKVRANAGPNVQVLGKQPWDKVVHYLSHAKAFMFAAEEDFGIAPVEAQACGTPVIGYAKGGLLETTVPHSKPFPTSVYFYEQTELAIQNAVETFEALPANTFKANDIRAHALQFDTKVFRSRIKQAVESEVNRRSERHPLFMKDSQASMDEAESINDQQLLAELSNN